MDDMHGYKRKLITKDSIKIHKSSSRSQSTRGEGKMSTSYNNNNNYSIYVKAHPRGFPDRSKLSRPHVDISWKVTESFKLDDPDFKEIEYSDPRKYDDIDVFASLASSSDDYMSPQRRDIISRMMCAMNFPFELDRLVWKDCFNRNRQGKPLDGVDDMISQILEVANGMIVSGRKYVDLIVEVEKQYTLAHEEYQAMVKARKEREYTEKLRFLDAELARVQDQPRDRAVNNLIYKHYQEIRTGIINEMRANGISLESTMDVESARLLEVQAMRESFDQVAIKPRPASRASVKALVKFVLEDDDAICMICMEEMTACKVSRTPCDHIFHQHCIAEWFKRWDNCPLCKHKLP